MTDIIRLLPDSIANQIAAGEVVQRPASVVKELLENAIDAKATTVQLVVKEAGKQLIQVIDDGTGMSETDARMSFERHATSKIRKSEDLFTIRTMGFRGEALASIAAVAQVEMRTRRSVDELGTLLRVEASEVKIQEAVSSLPGTNLLVKNLFFNVPARRNFLKSNSVEMRHILDEFQRVALAHPDIAFSLYQNDLEVYNLQPGKLSHRIVTMFGKSYREQLAACQEDTPFVKVTGFVGKPEFARKTRGEQFFFVNQRFIKHGYLHHAVLSAFEGLLPDESHPFYVLFIEIDPVHIDINVHPTKTEIKFDDERSVYAIVRSAAKKALGLYNISPSLDFEADVNFHSSFPPTQPRDTGRSTSGAWENEKTPRQRSNEANWQKLHQDFQAAFIRDKGVDGLKISPSPTNRKERKEESSELAGEMGNESTQAFPFPKDSVETFSSPTASSYEETVSADPFAALFNSPKSNPAVTVESKVNQLSGSSAKPFFHGEEKITFQLHNRYIITQVKSGMLLIDQQSAHERILYEKYLAALERKNGASQQFLFPQTITLNPADFQLVMEMEEEIRNLGFRFSVLGHNSLVVNGIPADVPNESEKDLFEGLIEQFKQHQHELRLEVRENIARSLAKRSALKPGVRLSTIEMNTLIDQLFASSNPNYSPNGHLTLVVMGMEKIASLFKI